MTNRKPHTPFRLVPKSTTLDDLERSIRTLLQKKCVLSEPTTKIWMKIEPQYQRQKCRQMTLVSGDMFYADSRGSSLCRGRQTTVGLSTTAIFSAIRSPSAFHWSQNAWPWMTLNCYLALNSLFATVWLAPTVRLAKNNCVKTIKDRHILSAAQIFGMTLSFSNPPIPPNLKHVATLPCRVLSAIPKVRCLMIILLKIYSWMCQWKNCERLLQIWRNCKVINFGGLLFMDTIYNHKTCGSCPTNVLMWFCDCSAHSDSRLSLRSYCVRPRTYGSYSRCCDGVVYNRTASVCCRGIQQIVADYTRCCGGLMYSPNSHLCCPGNIPRYKIYGSYSRCCGSQVYKYTTHSCCNSKVYDRDDYVCCSGELRRRNLGSSTGCCGSSTYNYRTQVCCSGDVRPRSYDAYTRCCGTVIYDYSDSLCCNGTVTDRTYGRNSSCCGSQVYNYRTHLCCKGTIVAKTYDAYSRCCGDRVINGRYYSCCAERQYHRSTKICCRKVIRDRVFGSFSRCCESVVYDYRASQCCSGVLHCKPSDSTTVYCCGISIYKPTKQICCTDCPGIASHSLAEAASDEQWDCERTIKQHMLRSVVCIVSPRHFGL